MMQKDRHFSPNNVDQEVKLAEPWPYSLHSVGQEPTSFTSFSRFGATERRDDNETKEGKDEI